MTKTLINLFLNIIEPLGEEELKYAIENDITLTSLVIEFFPGVVIQLRKLANKYSDRLWKVTADALREWLIQHREDLRDILHTDEGYRWLKKNIDDMMRLVVGKTTDEILRSS